MRSIHQGTDAGVALVKVFLELFRGGVAFVEAFLEAVVRLAELLQVELLLLQGFLEADGINALRQEQLHEILGFHFMEFFFCHSLQPPTCASVREGMMQKPQEG